MPKTLHNIIVVDDDCISLFLITKILDEQQVTKNILPFTDGISALQYLSANAHDFYKLPEVIFLDIKMPEISGWQFLQQLNNINFIEGYKPAVFIISADINIDFTMRETFPLIKGYFVKPIKTVKLITLLESFEMKFENKLAEKVATLI